MFNPGQNLSSFANPARGAAFSSQGMKPEVKDVFFSVGENHELESPITAVVSEGVMELSMPIGYESFGVGYKVGETGLVISKKFSESKWGVVDEHGNDAENQSHTIKTLTSHGSDLKDIFVAIVSSRYYSDLVANGIKINIALYGGTSYALVDYVPSEIKSSKYNYVNIFAPTDTRKECNASMRHIYSINSLSSSGCYVSVSCIRTNGDRGIRLAQDGYIRGCLIKGPSGESGDESCIGIELSGSGSKMYLSHNVIDGFFYGIRSKASLSMNNNIICSVARSLSHATGTINANIDLLSDNIFEGSEWTMSSAFKLQCVPSGNIASDAPTIGGEWKTNTIIHYADSDNNDYRTITNDFSNLEYAKGEANSGETVDFYGNPLSDISSCGAVQYTPNILVSIGKDDLSTGKGVCSVKDSVITFTESQTLGRLASGYLIKVSSGSKYILYNRIDDQRWSVTSVTGGTASDAPTGTFTSKCRARTLDGLNAIISKEGSDLVSRNTRYTANIIADTIAGEELVSIVSDRTRNVTYRTPYRDDECSSPLRNSKVYDSSLPVVNGILSVSSSGAVIKGLQFSSGSGIKIAGGNNFTIEDNFIVGCISVSKRYYDLHGDTENKIKGNIIVESEGNAVEIKNTPVSITSAKFETDDPDSFINLDTFGDGIDIGGYRVVSTVNNIEDIVYWTPGKVEISTSEIDGVSFTPKIVGEPWAILTTGSHSLPKIDTVMSKASSIVTQNSRDTDSGYHIENNTILNACGYGVVVESTNDGRSTNTAIIQNNIINMCGKDAIRPGHFLSGSTSASGNIIDDYNTVSVGGVKGGLGKMGFRGIAEYDLRLTAHDNKKIDINGASAGAIEYSIDAEGGIVYSFGTPIPLVGSAKSVIVRDGIAKFDNPIGSAAGIGDAVKLSSTSSIILYEKITDTEWVVKNDDGTLAADTSSKAIDIRRYYKDTTTFNEDKRDMSSYPLVRIAMYNDREYEVPIIPAMTNLQEGISLMLFAPSNTDTECNTRQRHNGSANTGATVRTTIKLSDHCGLDGLVVKSETDGIEITSPKSGSLSLVKNCIVHVKAGYGISSVGNNSITPTIHNCIVYGVGSTGIYCSGDSEISNCTSNGPNTGFKFSGTVVNCIATNNVHGYLPAVSSSAYSTVWSVSSDDTASGAGSKTNVVVKYKDAENGDFRLRREDYIVIGAGRDSTGYDVSRSRNNYGIRGNQIKNNYCIGADTIPDLEVRDLYLSASSDRSNFAKGTHVSIKSDVATFRASQTSDGMGVGDTVTYGNKLTAVLTAKITNSSWVVKSKDGSSLPDTDGAVELKSIRHSYTNISSAILGFKDIVRSGIRDLDSLSEPKLRVNITLFDDDVPVTDRVLISGYTASEDCYFNIYSPVDNVLECNTIQGHMGLSEVNSNKKIVKNGSVVHSDTRNKSYAIYNSASGTKAIEVRVNYTRIQGLNIQGANKGSTGIYVSAKGCKINRVVVHNLTIGVQCAPTSSQTTIANSIAYNSNVGLGTIKAKILNNTVVNCSTGYATGEDDVVVNCIYTGNGKGYANSLGVRNCISSDGSIERGDGNKPFTPVVYSKMSDDSKARLWPVNIGNKTSTQGAGTRDVIDIDPITNYDITGVIKRRKRFDIGAHRHVVDAPQAASVGKRESDGEFSNKIKDVSTAGSSLTMNVKNIGGAYSLAMFSEPLVMDNLAVGDTVYTSAVVTDYNYQSAADSSSTIQAPSSVNKPMSLIERLNDRTWVVAYKMFDGDTDLSVPYGRMTARGISTTADAITGAINNLGVVDDMTSANTNWIINILSSSLESSKDEYGTNLYATRETTSYNNTVRIIMSDGADGMCSTSQRLCYHRNDAKYERTFVGPITLHNFDYAEVSGVYMPTDLGSRYKGRSAIELNNCSDTTVDSNFVFSRAGINMVDGKFDSFAHGILVKSTSSSSIGRCLINNNIICDAAESGIRIESEGDGDLMSLYNASYLSERSKVCIVNNTTSECVTGISTDLDSVVYPPLVSVVNNLVRYIGCKGAPTHRKTDYSFGNRSMVGSLGMVNNISSDGSANSFVGGEGNSSNVNIQFTDAPFSFFPDPTMSKVVPHGENGELETIEIRESNRIIDNGKVISSRDCMPMSVDAAGNERRQDSWDGGALEMVRIAGSGNMLSPYPSIRTDIGYSGSSEDVVKLYLRKQDPSIPIDADKPWLSIESGHLLSYVDNSLQFPTIDTLSRWVNHEDNDSNLTRNLSISVEGGEYFSGVFRLGNRSPKYVIIKSQEGEEDRGAASIVYGSSLISSDSYCSKLTLSGLKVFSGSSSTAAIINNHNGWDHEELDVPQGMYVDAVNCYLQTDTDCIVSSGSFGVRLVNCSVLYRNNSDEASLVLTKGTVFTEDSHFTCAYNSYLLTYSDKDVTFTPSSTPIYLVDTDRCMSYNFGDGQFGISGAPVRSVNYPSVNPDFTEFIIVSRQFNVEIAMNYDQKVSSDSPSMNAGDDKYVEGIAIDSYGNPRRYLGDSVDIGPIEAQVHIIEIETDNIFSIEQKKLYVNNDSDTLQSFDLDKTFRDAYYKFDGASDAQEFVRESNVLIELKTFVWEYTKVTDKFNTLLVSMRAVLDSATKTLIVEKDQGYNGNFLAAAFDDGRYRFHFDEIKGILSVYVHDTYDKGTSGKSNLINNVRFSGTRMISG